MRVLHIVNDVTDRGNGIVNTAVDLAMEQVRQGLNVAVASAGGGYQSLLERAGIPHLTLDQSRHPGRLFRAGRTLHRQLCEFQPDVVHAHMRTGLLLAKLLKSLHHFSLVGHVHNVHDRESIVMGLADRVIAVSESVAETMNSRGIPRRKIRVVLNRTLGSGRIPSIETIQPAVLSRPSIVTVCGMSQRKGIEELIESFDVIGREFQDAHLYLVGDGPDRECFECQAGRCRWSNRIHFEGYRSLPQAYMLSADVFVLASRRESFGLVLIEAREAGCAIVATDVDGVAEALDGGRAGMLVRKRNVPALASALSRVLGNPAEQAIWRSRARDNLARFRVDRMALEMNLVYQELIARTGDHAASRNVATNSLGVAVKMRSQQPVDDRGSQAGHL